MRRVGNAGYPNLFLIQKIGALEKETILRKCRYCIAPMSDYRATLANCTLHGVEFTSVTKNGSPRQVRNLIRLHAAGFELELHQDPNLPVNHSDLAGQFVNTTDLYVRDVVKEDVSRVQEVVGYVCELLSFATESRVLPHTYEYPVGSGLGCFHSMVGTVQQWRRPFDQPEHAQHFVNTCYDSFVRLRNRRMLHVAIDYLYHSVMRGIAEEIKIALACVAFENLRDNFARDTGYSHIDGYFREKGTTTKNNSMRVGFKRHLDEMFADVQMTCDSERIVDTRNEVIHTGLLSTTGDTNWKTFEFLETALREYFLRLVGYHGPFLAYTSSPASIIL